MPSGQFFFEAPMCHSSTGTLWFLPTQNVLHPASRSTVAIGAAEGGTCEL